MIIGILLECYMILSLFCNNTLLLVTSIIWLTQLYKAHRLQYGVELRIHSV